MAKSLHISPVGVIRKSQDGKEPCIHIFKKYRKALMGLEQFSHIHVLYWFHKNDIPEKRAILQVHPCNLKENPLTGVFATHSPMRPNLIALARCRILGIEDTIIRIDAIDAFDGSPVVDIKSYFPYDHASETLRVPTWKRKSE